MADGVTPVVSPDQNSGKKTNPTNDLDSQSLRITTGIITDLKEDIRRLKAELEMKDALLSKFMDVSFAQSKRLTSLSAALQDTAPWDPSTCAHPSSSSTPRQRSLDEEVVVRRSRMRSDETRKPPVLSLSNRFSGLAADSPAPSAAVTAAQTPPDLGSTMDFPVLRRDATEIPWEDGRIAACSNPDRGSRITAKAPSGSDERLDLPASSRAPASSSRRRILKEAVRFHSSKARASPPQMDHRPQATLSISPERSQFRRYETIVLSCAANSTSWTVKRNTSLHSSQKCQYGWGIPGESSCKIDTAYPSDTGVYWCENDHRRCSNVVNLTITESPVIMESPPYGVTEGDSVTLRCSYKDEHQDSSTTNFSANFYQDGEFLEEGKEGRMVLTSISQSSEGFYSCEHSSRRKMSAKSWLAVKAKVKLPEAPPTPDPHHIIWIRITAGVMVFVLHITVFLLCLYTYRRWARGRGVARK